MNKPFLRPSRRVALQADKMCRDVVSAPKDDFVGKGKSYKVSFLTANQDPVTIDCPDDKYILDAAEEAGLDLPATCRGGICGACVVRVAKGAVDQSDIDDLTFTLEEEQIEAGMALICMARAKGDCELETQCDWGLSLGIKEWSGASGKLVGEVEPLMGKKWTELQETEAK